MRRARYFLRWPCLRQLSSAVLLSGLVCLQPLAQPAADSASTVSRIEQPSAEDWLQKMARSSRQLNYRGTLVYSRGRQMESLQFSHVLDREGVQHEHLRSLSGRPREIIRRGDMVFRLRADGSAVRLPRDHSTAPFGRDYVERLVERLRAAAPHYHAHIAGHTRVAGRPVMLLQLQPRDQHRYALRLALDKKSGLLLQSITTDRAGLVLERLEYTEVAIGIDGDALMATVPSPSTISLLAKPLAGLPSDDRRLHRWHLAWVPPGFSLAPPAEESAGKPSRALYSDGLATFSVFVSGVNSAAVSGKSQRELSLAQGATIAYHRQRKDDSGRYSVTVVGEIPTSTAERIAAAVVRSAAR